MMLKHTKCSYLEVSSDISQLHPMQHVSSR
jgi:hypothetical protein